MSPIRSYAERLDWPAALGVVCYFASWHFATLWQGTDDYWFALRIYPLGLLLTIAMFCGVVVWLLFRGQATTLCAKLVWCVLLALELNEILVYGTCRLLNNPLLDPEGNRIGEMEMALLWGVEVHKMTCARLLEWLPPDALSWVGALVIAWVVLRAWQMRPATES